MTPKDKKILNKIFNFIARELGLSMAEVRRELQLVDNDLTPDAIEKAITTAVKDKPLEPEIRVPRRRDFIAKTIDNGPVYRYSGTKAVKS